MPMISAKVTNEYSRLTGKPTGNILVTPESRIYSRELKGELADIVYSPDSDYTVFPQDLLERLVHDDEPFCMLVPVEFFGEYVVLL